jgi:hypothetical protein
VENTGNGVSFSQNVGVILINLYRVSESIIPVLCKEICGLVLINLLAPEFFKFFLAHPVCKM